MSSSPSSQPRSRRSSMRSPLPPEAPKESAVSRLLIAPLTFISFLVSLALIDSRNNSLRTHSHSPGRPAPTTFLGRVKEFLHSLIWKRTTNSPYAYIKSPNEKDAKGDEVRKGGKEEPWHWHTKQRHMMKAEMDDAFRVRKWVVIFLIVFGVAASLSALVVARWVRYVWRNWESIGVRGRLTINRPAAIMYGGI